MTVKELKDAVNSIPSREDDRNIAIGGDLIEEMYECYGDVEVSWIDCSDAMLILINDLKCNGKDYYERKKEEFNRKKILKM